MPKVFLTEEQRLQDQYNRMFRKIVGNLAVVKNRERLSQEQLAHRIGVSRSSIGNLLSGDHISMDTMCWLRLLNIAGLKIVDSCGDSEKEGCR